MGKENAMAVEILHIERMHDDKSVDTSAGEEKGDLFKGRDLGLLLWLTLFGFGGGLLSLYYANVGYFPDIKWDESLTYLGVMTIAGAFLLIVYGLLLLLPGWIWSKYLIHEEYLADFLCDSHSIRSTPCVRNTLRYIAMPFLSSC
jgi:hypothetical protein